MTRLLPGMAFVLIGLGLAGCEASEPEPAKNLDKKIDELNRKIEDLQSLLAEIKQTQNARSAAARPLTSLEQLWCKDPPLKDTPLAELTSGKPSATSAESRVMMVNSHTLRLNYDLTDIGKASVKTIEVWATQDSQSWKRLKAEPPAMPPAPLSLTVELPAEGRWGFKLIVRNEVGRGEPNPDRNTKPDKWVEVDLSQPKVKILGTDIIGVDNDLLSIRWTAQDAHLADKPITISYSIDKTNWHPIATGIANDGRFDWRIPNAADLEHHSVHIRVEAVDLAANLGSDQTAHPVVIDVAIPKARIKAMESIQGVPFPAPPPPPV